MRKQSRFDLCDNHKQRWNSNRDAAAAMGEGGPPAGEKPCSPRPCKFFPGSDMFAAWVTDEWAEETVRDWDVNRQTT
jgi:hypothetical protein